MERENINIMLLVVVGATFSLGAALWVAQEIRAWRIARNTDRRLRKSKRRYK